MKQITTAFKGFLNSYQKTGASGLNKYFEIMETVSNSGIQLIKGIFNFIKEFCTITAGILVLNLIAYLLYKIYECSGFGGEKPIGVKLIDIIFEEVIERTQAGLEAIKNAAAAADRWVFSSEPHNHRVQPNFDLVRQVTEESPLLNELGETVDSTQDAQKALRDSRALRFATYFAIPTFLIFGTLAGGAYYLLSAGGNR